MVLAPSLDFSSFCLDGQLVPYLSCLTIGPVNGLCVITGLSSVRECKYDSEHRELEMVRGLRVTKTFCAGIKARTIQRCKGKTRLLAANNSKKLIHTVQLNLRTTLFFLILLSVVCLWALNLLLPCSI